MHWSSSDIKTFCTVCKKQQTANSKCENCIGTNSDVEIARYAMALKTAMKCWKEAFCAEHEAPCAQKLQKFAQTLVDLETRIDKLEVAIIAHKGNNAAPTDNDLKLYKLI